MLADEAYCGAICDLLQPEGLSLEGSPPPKPKTQVPLKTPNSTRGIADTLIPDMLIEANRAVLLVEVKIALGCALNENQEIDWDDSGELKPSRYVQYLKDRKQKGHKVGLCLLVPKFWKFRREKANKLSQWKNPQIPVQLKTWEDVCTLTKKFCTRTVDRQFQEWLRQFATLLESDSMSISFTEDESSLLASDPGLKAFGSASVKLQGLVKQTATELEAELAVGSLIKFKVVSDPWGDASQYGATVYREGKEVLWFGIWALSDWPLVVGYDETWEHPDLSGLPEKNACKEWKAFGLPKECFTGEQPMSNLVKKVVSVLLPRPS
jgi:hypothetical protein